MIARKVLPSARSSHGAADLTHGTTVSPHVAPDSRTNWECPRVLDPARALDLTLPASSRRFGRCRADPSATTAARHAAIGPDRARERQPWPAHLGVAGPPGPTGARRHLVHPSRCGAPMRPTFAAVKSGRRGHCRSVATARSVLGTPTRERTGTTPGASVTDQEPDASSRRFEGGIPTRITSRVTGSSAIGPSRSLGRQH